MLSVGISINGSALTGVQTGLQEAVGSIEGTINNEFFLTIAVMFIGFAVIVLGLRSIIIGLRRSNSSLVFILEQRNKMDEGDKKRRAKQRAEEKYKDLYKD